LLGLAVVATSSFGAAVPGPIRVAYNRVDQVVRRLDFQGFKAMFAENFTTTDSAGKTLGREEFFGMVEPLFKGNKSATSNHRFSGAKTHAGVVDVSFDMHVMLTGKGGKTAVHEVGVDTWKKVNGKWVMVKTVDKVFTIKGPK
jgi:hypothetical protein